MRRILVGVMLMGVAIAAVAAPSVAESSSVSLAFRVNGARLEKPVDIEARFRSIWYSNFSDLKTTEARGMFLLVR